MTVLEKIFAGNTGRFAVELEIRSEPDGTSDQDDDFWGAFRLWARGRNLCAHTDQEDGAWDAIHWYFGDLLEWLIDNWDGLLHEQSLPIRSTAKVSSLADAFASPPTPPARLSDEERERWEDEHAAAWRRHSLLAARAGGPMPEAALQRSGDDVLVSWTGRDAAGTGLRYVERGGWVSVPVIEVAKALYQLLRGASDKLVALHPDSPRWADAKTRVEQIAEPTSDIRERRSGWLIGGQGSLEKWYTVLAEMSEDEREGIRQEFAYQAPDDAPVQLCGPPALLFGTLTPSVSAPDAAALLSAMARSRHAGMGSEALDEVATSAPLTDSVWPYMDGYAQAHELRSALQLGAAPVWDLEQRLEGWGIRIEEISLQDPDIPAVCLTTPEHRPTILINTSCRRMSRTGSRRIALVHELGHLLHDRDRAQRVAIAEGAWAPLAVEQRARAFAIMFLLPDDGIREYVQDTGLDLSRADAIRAIADHFGVSRMAAAFHLQHLGWLEEGEVEGLIDELDRDW